MMVSLNESANRSTIPVALNAQKASYVLSVVPVKAITTALATSRRVNFLSVRTPILTPGG